MRKRFLGAAISVVLLLGSAEEGEAAPPRTLLVYSGKPRGGSGDIAANWSMARLLKRLRPGYRLVFLVDERGSDSQRAMEFMMYGRRMTPPAIETVRRFVPRYRTGRTIEQEGVEVTTYRDGANPRGDHMLGFSLRPSDGFPAQFFENAPTTWVFGESRWMVEEDHFVEFSGSMPDHPTSFGVYGGRGGMAIVLPTDAVQQGLYISPEKSEPPLSRQATADALAVAEPRIGWLRWGGRRLLGGGKQLSASRWAVSYSSRGGPSQQYTDFVAEQTRDPNHQAPTTLFVRNFGDIDYSRLPPHVRVLAYDSVSAPVHESLVAHGDLPMMVSGTGTLSTAAQYEKFFFYDPTSPALHTGIPGPFLDALGRSALPRRKGDRVSNTHPGYRVYLNVPSEGVGLAGSMTSAEHGRRYGYHVADLVSLGKDVEFQGRFLATLRARRPQFSLPVTVLTYLDLVDQSPGSADTTQPQRLARAILTRNARRLELLESGWQGVDALLDALRAAP